MGQLPKIEAELKALGIRIIALSPDRPAKLKATVDKHKLGYQLLSDSPAAAIRALGLAFRVDNATIERYKRYRIDLVDASGRKHYLLPVPAVFLVVGGIVRFAYANPNYRVRIDPAIVLAAARAMLKAPKK